MRITTADTRQPWLSRIRWGLRTQQSQNMEPLQRTQRRQRARRLKRVQHRHTTRPRPLRAPKLHLAR
jgi:hypothetical protein